MDEKQREVLARAVAAPYGGARAILADYDSAVNPEPAPYLVVHEDGRIEEFTKERLAAENPTGAVYKLRLKRK